MIVVGLTNPNGGGVVASGGKGFGENLFEGGVRGRHGKLPN